MKKSLYLLIILSLYAISASGQQSTNFILNEHTFNNGGDPYNGLILTSTSYQITLDAVGTGIAQLDVTSGSYQLDAGFVPPYVPPTETLNLVFSTQTTLVWDPEKSVGAYNLYRGTIVSLPGTYGTCNQAGLLDETATESSSPPPGTVYFYVVTAENRLAEEGTKGFSSVGSERDISNPCP